MLRVIAGELKGRRLSAPKDKFCRPTLDRVKESIFNVLGADVIGRHALDLFCGSGSLGIEALSRGAIETVFVDSQRQALMLARKNISALGLDNRAGFVLSDILKLDRIGTGSAFDLIFADPPYDMMIGDTLLDLLVRKEILARGGLLVYERSRKEKISPGPLNCLKSSRFGQTEVDYFLRLE